MLQRLCCLLGQGRGEIEAKHYFCTRSVVGGAAGIINDICARGRGKPERTWLLTHTAVWTICLVFIFCNMNFCRFRKIAYSDILLTGRQRSRALAWFPREKGRFNGKAGEQNQHVTIVQAN